MSRKHSRKRPAESALHRAVRHGFETAQAHPLRLFFFALLNACLVWAVLTKSLPYVLAASAPDSALALNPNNPEALVAKAGRSRERLLSLMEGERKQPNRESGRAIAKPGDTIAALPEAGDETGTDPDTEGERRALRGEIRNLALRAIANDPLNARAYRLLAEVTDNPDNARILMNEALKRSRRETAAIFWLFNDAYYRKDFKEALDFADVLFRARPDLSKFLFNFLTRISQNPEGRAILVQQLANNPPWRRAFLVTLPAFLAGGGAAMEIAAELKSTSMPATAKDLAPLLNYLVEVNRADEAYNAWLQVLPPAQLEGIGLLTNPAFESDPEGSPFDWKIDRGLNAAAELIPAGNTGSRRLLHISFNGGRVRFPEVSQFLLLSAGRYRFEGVLRGAIAAKRGLRWQLRCAAGSKLVLGETEMLQGQTGQWRVFALQADIPPGDCSAQMLRLYHDARSASEELISGEVWFSGLHLERMHDTAGNSAPPIAPETPSTPRLRNP